MPFVAPPHDAEYTDIVEAAFGYTRDVDSATWVWTDITRYVRGQITVTKGRPDATSTADPTHIQLTLENTDGRFTKGNPLSPYWPNVVRGVPLRVSRTWKNAGATYERATAFVAGWPIVPVAGVRYVLTPIDAWGRLRQLRRDNTLVASPLRRTSSVMTGLFAYWPMEDVSGATQFASAVGGRPLVRLGSGLPTFADAAPTGSASLPRFNATDAQAGMPYSARVSAPAGAASGICISVVARVNTLGLLHYPALVNIRTSTGLTWQVSYNTFPGPGQALSIATINAAFPTGIGTSNNIQAADDGEFHLYQVNLVQNGASVQVRLFSDGVSDIPASNLVTDTLGIPVSVTVAPGYLDDGTQTDYDIDIGHVSICSNTDVDNPPSAAALTLAVSGYSGESATARMTRLCTENSVPVTTSAGTLGTPQPLGGQGVDTLGNLLDVAADADCGLLHDGGPNGDLAYASPGARYNATAQMTVAYASSQISDGFSGTDDDQTLTNDVTITRSGGSSGEWVNAASATAEGRITGQDTLNLHDDQQPDKVAQFRSNLSSFDAMRFPLAPLDFRRNPELVQSWVALTLPAYLAIGGVPSPFPPASIDQFIEGYTEVLDAVTWTVTANCSPAAPWRVMVLDDATNPFRLDAEPGSLLVNAGVSASATSFGLKTVSGPLFTVAGGDFPFLIEDVTTGEVMRLTNVTGGASPQTATVVRAINGVSKALGTNDPIRLYRPATLAL